MDTPAEVMGEVKAAAAAHVAAHPGDFAADPEVTAFIIACSDPMKLQLGVFVQYAHNGGRQDVIRSTALANPTIRASQLQLEPRDAAVMAEPLYPL